MAEEIKQPNHRREHWMSYILPVALIAGLVALLTIIADRPSEELQPIIPEEEWLTHIAGYLIIAAEAAAALVIGSAVITAIISYIRHLFDGLNKQINYKRHPAAGSLPLHAGCDHPVRHRPPAHPAELLPGARDPHLRGVLRSGGLPPAAGGVIFVISMIK